MKSLRSLSIFAFEPKFSRLELPHEIFEIFRAAIYEPAPQTPLLVLSMGEHVRTLADIPEDPFHSQSQPLSSEVTSFRNSSIKKSSELALAVNNLGVTIYDVGAAYDYSKLR